MAANQVNFQVFSYTDDDANVWNKRGELDAAINAIDGSTALTAGKQLWPRETRRYHTRHAIFWDPTTFRTKRIVVYTPAAFAALNGASTLNVNVPGNVAAVSYTLVDKVAEKRPVAHASRQLADHA
jgi:hypothetical protein